MVNSVLLYPLVSRCGFFQHPAVFGTGEQVVEKIRIVFPELDVTI